MLKAYSKKVKVLLVEDEEKLGENLKKALDKQGYTVYYFPAAEDAEFFLSQHHEVVDIILLDWMLPGKSGVEMCKTLRNKGICLPILMLTARDMPRDIVSSLDAGVDDYVTKPFSLDVLLARMRALERRSERTVQHISSELRIGDLVLSKAERKVSYKQKNITLTLREFNLLQYLMEHPNIVLEREIILEKVWDMNFDTFSNVVDVHIKNIRKKLNEVTYNNMLETVRGIGYKIKK